MFANAGVKNPDESVAPVFRRLR